MARPVKPPRAPTEPTARAARTLPGPAARTLRSPALAILLATSACFHAPAYAPQRNVATWQDMQAARPGTNVPADRSPAEPGRTDAPATPSAPPRPAAITTDPLTALGLPADTPLRGETLMRVRTLLGIRLEDIADRTKIGAFTLRCIETEAWADLPARVYLKGFLRQIAPLLRLDPDRLGRDYLAAFEAWENDNRRKKRW